MAGVFLGDIEPTEIYVGDQPAAAVYVGEEQIWPIGGRTVLLLHLDGTDGSTAIIDAAGRHSPTVTGNTQIDTAQSVFGGASALFDGDGDTIAVSASADFLFTEDFTLDCRVRLTTLPAGSFATIYAFNSSRRMLVTPTGRLAITSGGAQSSVLNSGFDLGINTWYHIALTRVGTTVRIFVDGDEKASLTSNTEAWGTSVGAVRIGGQTASSNEWNGWIDEFRILKGEGAWDTDFTPPTEAYS